jgi:hypothetical protein
MATIVNAHLARQAVPGGISRMTVTYSVNFSQVEQTMRPSYAEVIELFGADGGLTGADDFLFRASQGSFQATGAASINRTRVFDVGTHILNEDWGKDEVYAKIRVSPRTPTGDTAKTNEISGDF